MSDSPSLASLEQKLADVSTLLLELKHDLERLKGTPAPEAPTLPPTLVAYLGLEESWATDKAMECVLQAAMHTVGGQGAGLTLYQAETERLVFRAAIGDGSEGILGYEVPVDRSQHGLAFATGEIQASKPLHSEIEQSAGVAYTSVLVAPLISGEDPIGTISVVNKRDGTGFSPGDIEAFQPFSELAAQIVMQKTREQAILQGIREGRLEDDAGGLAVNPEEQAILGLVEVLAPMVGKSDPLLQAIRNLIQSIPR